MRNSIQKNFGFSLLEVIIVIVLSGILAVMILPYFYSGAISSNTPIERLQTSSELNMVMEAIVSGYESCESKNSSCVQTVKDKISNFATNYGTYCSTCSATTQEITIEPLAKVVLVTVTSGNNEKLYYALTEQAD